MKLGIISDTHGIIHPKVFELFDQVDIILHAGDIDSPEILTELESLAPVTAVLGNVDGPDLYSKLKKSELLTFESVRILLVHQALDGDSIHNDVQQELNKHKIDIVIFGHTHKPLQKVINGTLFLNPGGAGRRRFNLPLGIGLIEINNGKFSATLEKLD